MTAALLITGWIACAVLAAGIMVAHFRGEFPRQEKYRQDLGGALCLGLFGGPVALVVFFFMSGFMTHGWTLRPPKREATA